jgi:hypothetical protein
VQQGELNMTKRIFIAGAIVLASTVLAVALTKPNFSGTWSMDKARSYGIPPDMTQTLTISHKDEQIEMETKIVQAGNERVVKDTYVLDGKEYEFTPQVPAGQPQPKGKRTATWLPGDKGLLVTDVTTVQTDKGPNTTQVVRKWVISSEGELVLDMFVDRANGSTSEAKRIFKKQ